MSAFNQLKYVPAFVLLFLVIGGCGPQNTMSESVPGTVPSVTASPIDKTSPTPTSSSQLGEVVSVPPVTPTPFPKAPSQPTSQSTPEVSETTIPGPAPTSFVEPILPNLAQGVIFDETDKPLAGVAVTVSSQNSNYQVSYVTVGDGSFRFVDVPTGELLTISAHKKDYALRERNEILSSRPILEMHTFDFNRFEQSNGVFVDYRLQQAPEVSSVTFESKGVPVELSSSHALLPRDAVLIIQFSEPMQQNTVNASLLVEALDEDSKPIKSYGQSDFTLIWNVASDTLRVKMKSDPDWLTTDGVYRLSFMQGSHSISDLAGTARTANHFKLSATDLTEHFDFKVRSN